MAGQWRDVAVFYQGRGARYGTMSIVSIVVFLGILIAVNYLGTRQSKRWDLTANQVFSLSDQTIKILKDLKEPVKVTVFERNDQLDVHRARLQEYQYQTTQLTTEFIDPDRQPTRAASAKIETLPTILFEYKGRTERVDLHERAGPHQRADQGDDRVRLARSISCKATARKTPRQAIAAG